MSKVLRVRIANDTYDLLESLAKTSGKSLSRLSAELLHSAVKQELKDTALLNKLIQKIENLSSEPQQENSYVFVTTEIEKLREDFTVILDAFVVLGEYFFIDRTKAEKFIQKIAELRKKIELH